jgi:endoglucanase
MNQPFRWIVLLGFAILLTGCAGLTISGPQPATETPAAPALSSATASPSQTMAPVPSTTNPADYLWPSAFAMNARLGRGVNFGNALEGDFEGAWGVVLQEEYFQKAAEAGFDTIRLPIRWNAHALESAPFTIDEAFFDRVDWAVENALSRGMNIILDFHHFYPYMDCAACERNRFQMLWQQIAAHYQDDPPELLFELLNEPESDVPAAEWNSAIASVLEMIRATNPNRIVIVGPVGWNNFAQLPTLQLPESDRGLIATFHYYYPFQFTHQGAEWADGSDAWLGTTWTGTPSQQRAIRRDFDSVAAWGDAHDRPVFLGEFGAYNRADMDSRARWTAFMAREAEARGFSWAYWEFCAGFGVYDPDLHRWREPLLEALLPPS